VNLVTIFCDFQSTGSASSAVDDLSDRSFHDMIDRMNEQMALDAGNAAAQQQFLAGMAAAQEMRTNTTPNLIGTDYSDIWRVKLVHHQLSSSANDWMRPGFIFLATSG
jgi:hypothetical protein